LAALKQDKPLAALQEFDQAVRLAPDHKGAQRELADLVLGIFIGDPSRPKELYERLSAMSRQWLAKDPQSAEGLRIKGYLAMVEKKPAEAVDLFRRAQQANPKDVKMNLGLMDALYRADHAAEAEKVGLDFIASDNSAGEVYDSLYRLYTATKRPADAENILIRKVQDNPKDSAYILQLANHYAGVQKKTEMEAAIQLFLKNPGGDSQVRLKAGDFYAAIGDWGRAVQQYNAGVRDSGTDKLIYENRIAKALLVQNKREEALKVLNATVAKFPDDREARSLRASLLLKPETSGKTPEGIQEFKALVDKNPDDAFLKFVYARALVEADDLSGARVQLQAVVTANPQHVEAQVLLADIAFQQGDLAATVQHATAALQVDPNNLRAQMLHGSALLRQGQFEESASILNRLSRLAPQSVDVRLQLAYLDTGKRRFAEAEAAFQKLLDANPKEWRAVAGLSDNDLAQGRPDKALARLEEQLTRSRGAPQVRFMLAMTALKTGRYGTAIEHFRQLADQASGSIGPHLRLADVFRLKGDVRSAIATLQKAALLDPKDPRPSSMLSFLYNLENQQDEAKAQARRALSLRPDDADALNNLAFVMAETGDNLDQALKLARQAAEKAPDSPFYADTVAYIHLKKDQNDQAIAILDGLVRKYPNNPDFAYHAGIGWYQMGQRSRAKSELARALQLVPPGSTETAIRDLLNRIN